jgi:hypothetical protein
MINDVSSFFPLPRSTPYKAVITSLEKSPFILEKGLRLWSSPPLKPVTLQGCRMGILNDVEIEFAGKKKVG